MVVIVYFKLQTGRIEPNYPKVCGHQGNVLDIKWNPFIENIIASCSEDTSVSWDALGWHLQDPRGSVHRLPFNLSPRGCGKGLRVGDGTAV